MASTPPVAPPPSRKPWFALPSGLSRRTLLLAGMAFGVGLVLFLLIVGQGEDDGFFRAGDAPVSGRADQVFEPLPTPDAVGGEDAAPGREAVDSAVSAGQPEQVELTSTANRVVSLPASDPADPYRDRAAKSDKQPRVHPHLLRHAVDSPALAPCTLASGMVAT